MNKEVSDVIRKLSEGNDITNRDVAVLLVELLRRVPDRDEGISRASAQFGNLPRPPKGP
jgi:hypothetical protein